MIRRLLERVSAARAEKPAADPLPGWAGFAAAAALMGSLYLLHRVTSERTDELNDLEQQIVLRRAELHALVGLKTANDPAKPYPAAEDLDPLAQADAPDAPQPEAARHETMIGGV